MRAQSTFVALALLGVVACNSAPGTSTPHIHWTPRGDTGAGPSTSTGGTLPSGFGNIVPTSLPTDFFHFTAPAVSGTATFTDAVVWDPMVSDMPPFGAGGVGTADITVGSDAFSVTDGDAMGMPWTDDAGVAYVMLSTFAEVPDGAGGYLERNVFVAVLATDFAPGAAIALDGTDRFAVFTAGPDTAPDPTVFAAAVTGTLTFGTGSFAVGDHLSATLVADFAPAESIPGPPPPAGVPLVAGAYDLVIDATPDVVCGGSMAGHEASFSAIPLSDLGASDGTLALALPTADQLSIDGAAIGTLFGAPALLDAVASPPDTFVATTDLTGTGPDGTDRAGAYVLVEGLPEVATLVHVGLGLSYVDPVADGGCDVVFHAELHAR